MVLSLFKKQNESSQPAGPGEKKPPSKKSQAIIVSHPKCGNTWLRVMLSKVLNDIYALGNEKELNLKNLTWQIKAEHDPNVSVANFKHENSCFREGRRFSYFPHDDKAEFAGKDIILLVRDPRDVLVSSFHQVVHRDQDYFEVNTDLSGFIRHETYGIRKLAAFYNSWARHQDVPSSFTVIRYEDMHADPAKALETVLNILNVTGYDPQHVATAVEFSRFDNMKKMEKENFFGEGTMQGVESDDNNTSKVRKGQIGGYKDELSPEDIEYVNAVMRQENCPLFSSYSA